VIFLNIPKEVKRHCPHCKTHQIHTVERIKTAGRRTTSNLKQATRYRNIKLHKGYGGSPYKKIEHGVKYGAKTSQKIMLRYKCEACGKKHQSTNPVRAKKFEIQKTK